jgi:hypothetical protein
MPLPPITPLPDPPTIADPATFEARADALLGALPNFVDEANALGAALLVVGLLNEIPALTAAGDLDGSEDLAIVAGDEARKLALSRLLFKHPDGLFNIAPNLAAETPLLTAASALNGTETIAVEQGGNARKLALSRLIFKDANGRVGIGTNSPGAELEVADTAGDNDVRMILRANASVVGQIGRSSTQMFIDTVSAHPFLMLIGGNEFTRFNASDQLIGTTSAANLTSGAAANPGLQITKDGGIGAQRNISANLALAKATGYSDANFAVFNVAGSGVGSISTTGSSVAFNTSSDHRLKFNVTELTGALARVRSLQAKRFNWLTAPDGEAVDGFIAHEAQAVVPESVTGTLDETRVETIELEPERATGVLDGEGDEIIVPAVTEERTVPVYQGIDQSKLIPLLWAAVAELDEADQAKNVIIANLSARLAALEAPA